MSPTSFPAPSTSYSPHPALPGLRRSHTTSQQNYLYPHTFRGDRDVLSSSTYLSFSPPVGVNPSRECFLLRRLKPYHRLRVLGRENLEPKPLPLSVASQKLCPAYFQKALWL